MLSIGQWGLVYIGNGAYRKLICVHCGSVVYTQGRCLVEREGKECWHNHFCIWFETSRTVIRWTQISLLPECILKNKKVPLNQWEILHWTVSNWKVKSKKLSTIMAIKKRRFLPALNVEYWQVCYIMDRGRKWTLAIDLRANTTQQPPPHWALEMRFSVEDRQNWAE